MSQTSHTPPASPSFLSFAGRIDRLNAAIGRAAAWACLFVVMVQFAVVVLRYVFGLGSIWLSESIVYGHAAMFMLASAWTLPQADTCGSTCSTPTPRRAPRRWSISAARCCFSCRSWRCWPGSPGPMSRDPGRSWRCSRETSGIPAVFLLKTLIPVFALLMALQGVSQAIKAVAVLRGKDEP